MPERSVTWYPAVGLRELISDRRKNMAAAREIQVQIADEPGALGKISELLANRAINIHGFGVWATTAHLIVSDVDAAVEILRNEAFRFEVVDVLCLVIPNEPGNLAEITRALGDAGINIDHAYTITGDTLGAAAFVLAVADTDQAEHLLD